MTKPLVLLAMTAFNREQFIAEAIDSVLAQKFTGWILHIVDDGSTDSTKSIIESYVLKDDRIQATYLPKNLGAAAALQVASNIEATYLGWIDSDDALTPNTLSELVPFLLDHPKVDCVYSQYNTMDLSGRDMGLGRKCSTPYSPDNLLSNFMVFHFRLMKWEAYKAIGVDPDFNAAVDYDFFLRFSERYVIEHFCKSLYLYRQHYKTISGQPHYLQKEYSEIAVTNALRRRAMQNCDGLSIKYLGGNS